MIRLLFVPIFHNKLHLLVLILEAILNVPNLVLFQNLLHDQDKDMQQVQYAQVNSNCSLNTSLDTMLTQPNPMFSALAANHRFCIAQQTL